MNTLKTACVIGIAACFERAYHYEELAGIGFIALLLIGNEARKRMKKT